METVNFKITRRVSAFPDASFTDVVRANVDTLYSTLWFDVTRDPLIIHAKRIATPTAADGNVVLSESILDLRQQLGPPTRGTSFGIPMSTRRLTHAALTYEDFSRLCISHALIVVREKIWRFSQRLPLGRESSK